MEKLCLSSHEQGTLHMLQWILFEVVVFGLFVKYLGVQQVVLASLAFKYICQNCPCALKAHTLTVSVSGSCCALPWSISKVAGHSGHNRHPLVEGSARARGGPVIAEEDTGGRI